MARRRRKSSRRKKKPQIRGKRKTASAGANFLAFILGMGTTVTGALAGYAAVTAEPVKVQPNTFNRDILAYDSGKGESKQFNALLRSDDSSEVAVALLKLNDWPRTAKLPVKISANRKREKLARKLLKMEPLELTDRELAIDSLIESLSAIYGLDLYFTLKDRQIADQLRTAAEQYLEDSNTKVRRSAQLAMLKYHAFEYLKYRRPEQYQPLETTLVGTLLEYANDSFARSNVKLIFSSLSRLDYAVYKKLTDVVVSKRAEFAGTGVEQLIAELADDAILRETGYVRMFDERWVNGSAGQKRLQEVSQKLAGDKATGVKVVEQVDRVAQWFERVNKLDQAKPIYQALIDAPERVGNPKATSLARRLGKHGLTRCAAIGHEAVFSGYDIDGKKLTARDFRGSVVAVVFWSVQDAKSKEEVVQLHREKSMFGSLPVEVIAVCIDKDPGKEFGKAVENLNRFHCTDPLKNGTGGIPFTNNCPISRIPQILLIDQDGKIADTNVPPDSLRTHVDSLITRD